MSLSIIPLIIVKTKSNTDTKKDKLNTIQTLIKEFNTKTSLGDLNYIEKYDKKRIKIQKYLNLLPYKNLVPKYLDDFPDFW